MRSFVSALVILSVILLATIGIAITTSANDMQPSGRSIEEFINPDGSFDLEAARRSGYEGALDMKGFESALDPVTGQPLFQPVAARATRDHPDDIYWDNSISPSVAGLGGDVQAATVYDGRLIVGGRFQVAGDVIVGYIASWDGSTWSSLGSGMEDRVAALTVYNGNLIAGGWFTAAGGTSARYIASWDGSAWSPLGSGMDNVVFALTVYDENLIAGGDFTIAGGTSVDNIASWDGSAWSPLASGTDDEVHALTVYDESLIVGGDFIIAGGTSASHIASWDGATWSPLGPGMDDVVFSLTVYYGNLIAGGEFTTAGGTSANYIASWDGTIWSPLASGMEPDYGVVFALTVYDGNLIAGGQFGSAGGTNTDRIASWDGTTWSQLGSGMNDEVLSLTVYDGNLIAGGWFTAAGGTSVSNIAFWDGTIWSPLASGMNGRVLSLIVYDGNLIAGGEFTTAGGTSANYIASWDGATWSPLGSGINNTVEALTVYDGNLIAGGKFTTAGGTSANYIASWDGSTWSPLGSGISSDVHALTVYDGNLIAGGWFSTAGGTGVSNIASWNDSVWLPLGSGIDNTVQALTVYDGNLIAGGQFGSAGGTNTDRIASWDGTTWSQLGSGMEPDYGVVFALTVYDGNLIAGGNFTTAGGTSANYIASWDGSTWSQLGSGMGYSVRALTVSDSILIAGGAFSAAGGTNAMSIASWDGTTWSQLGSGMKSPVHALTVYDGDVIAGGHFTVAGGKVSAYLAEWTMGGFLPTGSIIGIISEVDSKTPVEGAEVKLIREGQELDSYMTGPNGVYAFLDVLIGFYDIEVWKENYIIHSTKDVEIGEGQATTRDYSLTEGDVLLYDNFDDGSADGFNPIAGSCSWQVDNEHAYTTSLIEGNRVWCIGAAGENDWQNYSVNVWVRGNAGVDKVVALRVQDQSSFYAINLRAQWGGSEIVSLNKMSEGTFFADIAVAECANSVDTWYNLTIEVLADKITVNVDGVPKLVWQDDGHSYGPAIPSGKIALCGWTGDSNEDGVSFDNVMVFRRGHGDFVITSDAYNLPNIGDQNQDYDADLPIFLEAFGPEHVLSENGELLRVAEKFFEDEHVRVDGPGYCAGMAVSCGLMFLGELALSEVAAELGQPGVTQVFDITRPAEIDNPVDEFRERFGWYVKSDEYKQRLLNLEGDPVAFLTTILENYNCGNPDIYVVGVSWGFSHVMVATKALLNPLNLNEGWIRVYDPSDPGGLGHIIIVNISDGTWEYEGIGPTQERNLAWTPASLFFGDVDPSYVSQQRAQEVLKGYICPLFIDPFGNATGCTGEGYVSDIPGSRRLYESYGGSDSLGSEVYSFLAGVPLRLEVRGSDSGSYSFHHYFASDLVLFESSMVDTTSVDHVRYLDSSNQFIYSTSDSSKHCAVAVIKQLPDRAAEHIFEIKNTAIDPGDTLAVEVGLDLLSMRYTNVGNTKSYDFAFERTGFDAGHFQCTGLAIDSGDTHILTPSVWEELDLSTVTVEVDEGSNGSVDTIYIVENEYDAYVCGDIDNNGTPVPDIADLIYLVIYMFQDGPAPPVMAACDMDGNSTGPDIADLIWMVTYMFQEGPPLQCP